MVSVGGGGLKQKPSLTLGFSDKTGMDTSVPEYIPFAGSMDSVLVQMMKSGLQAGYSFQNFVFWKLAQSVSLVEITL